MTEKQTELARVLEFAYVNVPGLREAMQMYEISNVAYQQALEALRPKYVIVDTNTTNPIRMVNDAPSGG